MEMLQPLDEAKIISLIKEIELEQNKTPTIATFAKRVNASPASIIRNFGSWNSLLIKAGCKLNKANKRSDKQLIFWLKSHPNATFNEIPTGIRNRLIAKFGSISNARIEAGLQVSDWRAFTKHPKTNKNAGRPIEYSKEMIIDGLRTLAKNLGRPPRMKDISKQTCGFPISAILSRFNTFNEALTQAQLPPVYSYHQFHKLQQELEVLLLNIKININNVPLSYGMEIGALLKPTFTYPNDKWELVKLTRNDIASSIDSIMQYKNKCDSLTVYYLVDDSLYENDNITMICVLDLVNSIPKPLSVLLNKLRLKYDEINRKYVGQPLL